MMGAELKVQRLLQPVHISNVIFLNPCSLFKVGTQYSQKIKLGKSFLNC